MDESRESELISPKIAHAEAGAIQAIKTTFKEHGEQTVLPDDRQLGDNGLCSEEL